MTGGWSSPEGQRADGPIHVYPINDTRDHVIDGLWCPCMPRMVAADVRTEPDGTISQPDNTHAVIRHNSYDGREVGEVVLRTLDRLAEVVTGYGHTWSASLRADYEQSVELIKLRYRTGDDDGN